MQLLLSAGRAHEALGKMQEAIDLHERHLELAKGSMSEEQEKKAAVECENYKEADRLKELIEQEQQRGAESRDTRLLRRLTQGEAGARRLTLLGIEPAGSSGQMEMSQDSTT